MAERNNIFGPQSLYLHCMNIVKRLKRFVVTTVIGGLLVLLPLVIFIVTVSFLFRFLAGLLSPLTEIISKYTQYDEFIVDVISFVAAILFCFLVGLLVRTRIGVNFFGRIENNWLNKLPLYSTIKETVQQFTGAKKMPFSEVVLVRPFSSATLMTGFITERHPGGLYTVFVPTGPNPTNGFIFHVNQDQIQHLDAGTDDAMKSIIGVGVGSAKILFADKIDP